MIWECSKVKPLWSKVTEFIADTFDFPNICSPLVCLLGVVFEDETMDTAIKLFLRLLFCFM